MNINISKTNKGQSLVESALVIPLVLLLIFTFLDLGRGIYYYSALGNAVREGARFASVTKVINQTEKDKVIDRVSKYSVAVPLQPNKVNVVFQDPGSDPPTYSQFPSDGYDYVTVTASYDFTPITPFLAQMLGSGTKITLNAESTMLLAPIAKN